MNNISRSRLIITLEPDQHQNKPNEHHLLVGKCVTICLDDSMVEVRGLVTRIDETLEADRG